ncbi:alanine racemase [Zooshikella harenae]|uniref:Alanine racemase n=1 Tax=Zooshikella harenae TaxID=2827238 RepID=A0ABS5ZD58_9GAMM|nr:alanine racemase [Zooshikella harenae]MBU2711920.1 alanine racemase [Zooshikella harenae]
MTRPIRATIDLNALQANYLYAKQMSATNAQALAVIKADAYGHGAIASAKALDAEADGFAVASVEEALQLRHANIKSPIVLLEGFFSAEELEAISHFNLQPLIHSRQQIEVLHKHPQDKMLTVWLKLDSGMHRLGFSPEQFITAYTELTQLPYIKSIICTSHFACADEPDHPMNKKQLDRCAQIIKTLGNPPASLANSPAILTMPDSHYQWLRPGIMLYGSSPFAHSQPQASVLKPVMTLTAEVIAIKSLAEGETIGYGASYQVGKSLPMGVVSIGYGDGYPRYIAEGAPVVINGIRCPIIGRVSMDMITVDLTNCPQANIGDTVELWGNQLSVNEIAAYANTISYELLTKITQRVPRHYIRYSTSK